MATQGEGDAGNGNVQLLQIGYRLLLDFIYNRLRRNGISNAAEIKNQLDEMDENESDTNFREIGQRLQLFGDELDNDVQLKARINSSLIKPTKEVFWKVACEIFSDWKFNWGRVVALFYFACELVKKAINVPDIISKIIGWTVDFMRDHVISWISGQGGWEAILSQFGTPSWTTLAAFVAGGLATALIMKKM